MPRAPSDLRRLDEALLRLRRLLHATPTGPAAPAADGGGVEVSTVFVADAVARATGDPSAASVGVGTVADLLGVTPSTASRLVDRAVRAGAVDRGTDPADPRRHALTLTPRGRKLLEAAIEFRVDYLSRILAHWDSGEVETLSRLLDRFAADVERLGNPKAPLAMKESR